MALKFGTGVPQGWRMDLVEIADPQEKYEAMTRAAKDADALGFHSLWLFDHFHTVPTPEMETTFECFTALAGLARDTKQIMLGQMATCNGYRNPALLAKIGSTIDVMSHGRFILGFGAGWYEHEWRAYGYGFPETKVRMAMFREATEIIHKMWTEDKPTFQGKYYQIDGPINEPKGVQKPHPPLWIAGSGEQVTLKLVAQWGDGCNVGFDDARQKFAVLRGHCDTLGRDYNSIDRSVSLSLHLVSSEANADAETAPSRKGQTLEEYRTRIRVMTPQQLVDAIGQKAEDDANYFIFYFQRTGYEDNLGMHLFAREVMPHFAQA